MSLAAGIAAIIAAAVPASALAATITTSVSASSTAYGGSLSVLNDGVFPPDYTPYNASTTVHDYSSATTFTFAFSGVYLVNQVVGAVDFNDDYTFTFFNGAAPTGTYTHAANSGPVNYGIQNFTASIMPVLATSVVLSTAGGDGIYGVGEADFGGTAAIPGVPEPASWAMMVGGIGLLGGALRRRRSPAPVRA